jgi:hypothetical protein
VKVGDVVSMGGEIGTLTHMPEGDLKGALVSVDFRGQPRPRRVYASWLKVCECRPHPNRDCPVHGDGN